MRRFTIPVLLVLAICLGTAARAGKVKSLEGIYTVPVSVRIYCWSSPDLTPGDFSGKVVEQLRQAGLDSVTFAPPGPKWVPVLLVIVATCEEPSPEGELVIRITVELFQHVQILRTGRQSLASTWSTGAVVVASSGEAPERVLQETAKLVDKFVADYRMANPDNGGD